MSGYYNPVSSRWNVSSPYQGGFRSTGGHSGVDIAAAGGTPIRAAVPGRVLSAGYSGAYGILIKVQHQDGSVGYYAHAQARAVKPGQQIQRGDTIGYVGNTGNVRGRNGGYHLHFEVRQNGKPTNPMPWLAKDRFQGGNQSAEPGYYDGVRLDEEQLRNAQIIVAEGRKMGATQRDIMIGLMTAMQESTLKNLDYGDRDSLGLFQQRPSQGWGSQSQVRDPVYASRKFFSTLLGIQGRGSMEPTEAAQAVQRSAYPDAYARWEELARGILGDPGAGSYNVSGYDTYYKNQIEAWRDPEDTLRGFLEFGGGITPTPRSPADSPGGEVAATPGGAVAASPVTDEGDEYPDFEFGDFGQPTAPVEGEAPVQPSPTTEPSTPEPEPDEDDNTGSPRFRQEAV